MANYAVVRLDNLSGQDVHADMRSLRMYDGTGSSANQIEVENGVIAELVALETGEREMWKAVKATSESDITDCVLIATPEVLYDERKRNLDDFINEAGKAARGYILRRGNIFSVTEEGFVSDTPPAVGGAVGIGTGGKLDASGTGFGVCIDINVVGRYTYYAIMIGETEANPS